MGVGPAVSRGAETASQYQSQQIRGSSPESTLNAAEAADDNCRVILRLRHSVATGDMKKHELAFQFSITFES
jgi:hypothetical protein